MATMQTSACAGGTLPPEDPAEGGAGLRSVLAAIDLLDCFTAADDLGVSEIARKLGLAKSTVHRLLSTLCRRGMAERDPQTGRYRLGMHLYELGELAVSRLDLRRAALPLLEEMRARTGFAVHLAVSQGPDVVYVERLPTLRSLPLLMDISLRLPAHCTACGKAIAAFNPTVARARQAAGFPAMTASSIHSAADYDRELRNVRQAGYAINHDEACAGLSSVAAPVCDRAGRARAAISLVGPTGAIAGTPGRHARLAQAAAIRLARSLHL